MKRQNTEEASGLVEGTGGLLATLSGIYRDGARRSRAMEFMTASPAVAGCRYKTELVGALDRRTLM